jgi:hypothetical protein
VFRYEQSLTVPQQRSANYPGVTGQLQRSLETWLPRTLKEPRE